MLQSKASTTCLAGLSCAFLLIMPNKCEQNTRKHEYIHHTWPNWKIWFLLDHFLVDLKTTVGATSKENVKD